MGDSKIIRRTVRGIHFIVPTGHLRPEQLVGEVAAAFAKYNEVILDLRSFRSLHGSENRILAARLDDMRNMCSAGGFSLKIVANDRLKNMVNGMLPRHIEFHSLKAC